MNAPQKLYSVESTMEYNTVEEALVKAQKRCTSHEQDYLVTKAVKKVVYPVPTNEVVDLS